MSHSHHLLPAYFVVMQNYGWRGREAIVDPELTRADIIARIVNGDYRDICFVQSVAPGEIPQDVTEEIMAEAMAAREAA